LSTAHDPAVEISAKRQQGLVPSADGLGFDVFLAPSNSGGALSDTLWTDDTGAFYVRKDTGSTVTFLTPLGLAATPAGGSLRPANDTVVLDKASYQATASGTGYSTNDLIDRLMTVNRTSGVIVSSFWLNTTTSAVIGTPAGGNITPLAAGLASGASTSAKQDTGNTSLAAIKTDLDNIVAAVSTAAKQDTGNTSLAAIKTDLDTLLTTVATAAAQTTASGKLDTLHTDLQAIIADTTPADVNLVKVNGNAISSTNPVPVKQVTATPFRNMGVTNTALLVAAGNYVLSSYYIENPDATNKLYVHFYDAATAVAVTVGTTTPVWSLAFDGKEKANIAGLHLNFALGIVIAASTTATGSTAPVTAAGVNLGYKLA
jgi:hypothetical protein